MTIVEVRPDASQAPAARIDPAPATRSASAATDTAHTIAEIVTGVRDSGGEKIDYVYFKRKDYAVYRRGAPPEVAVAYSDNDAVANEQIAAVSTLLPLRDRLAHLIDNLPPRSQDSYRAQIADALRLGLEKQETMAQALLAESVADALAAQGRRGRLVYLKWTAIAIAPALILILIGGAYVPNRAGAHLLLMSVGAGAIGAVLSIAIGIRARTVAIEGDWRSNAVDAAVRVGIGMISAAVLFLVLNSGILTNISAGGVSLTGTDISWQVALIIGFAAGFLERLVPDLLDKSVPASKPAVPPPATGAAGVAPPANQ